MRTTKSVISFAIVTIFIFNSLLAQEKTTIISKDGSEQVQVNNPDVKGKVPVKYNPSKGEWRLLKKLFTRSESGETILNPKQFSEITSNNDLQGVRVYAKKDGKFYKFLGNQDDLISLIQSPELRPVQCDPSICGERVCDNGTIGCICINEYCLCMICPGSNMSDL
jgi:hypothetical protein